MDKRLAKAGEGCFRFNSPIKAGRSWEEELEAWNALMRKYGGKVVVAVGVDLLDKPKAVRGGMHSFIGGFMSVLYKE